MKTIFFACMLAVAAGAGAQTWPAGKPVRLLVGVPAGAGPDVETRQFAAQLAAELGQQVIVENRPGFGGLLAMEAVAKAPADGYTLGSGQIANLGSHPRLFDRPLFDVDRDLAAVSLLGMHPFLLYVHSSVAAQSVGEFVALAKARPGQLTFASGGVGTLPHVAGEWFQKLADVRLAHVPYGAGNPATDVIAGHVNAMFYPLIGMTDAVRGGKLRALAISGRQRARELPEVPTFAEAGMAEFAPYAWFGVVAPAGTPPEVMDRLSRATVRAVAREPFQVFLTKLGATPVGSSPAEFDAFGKAERAKWRKLIQDTGIRIE